MKKSLVLLLGWIIFVVLIGMSKSLGSETVPLVLLNGTLIDGTGAKPVQNAVVVVQQDRVLAAGPAEQVNIPANARRLDIKEATILPGFINAHIVASTKNAARVCNLEQIIGTIEPGKIADILVVKGNPLDDLHVLTNVVMVIHNGVIIRQETAYKNEK